MSLETDLLNTGLAVLRERLPKGWEVQLETGESRYAEVGIDATVIISAPDGRSVTLAVEAKPRFEPRDALLAGNMAARLSGMPLLVVSTFLSPGTRERLMESALNWIDLTGNARLVLCQPGLFIATEGEKRLPGTTKRPARSLKGLSAGRVVRTLLTTRLPINLSDLAPRAEVDPGYVSRILNLLDKSALIEREPRGPVIGVDRPRLVRRWAEDAPLKARGAIGTFLEPRGLFALLERLRESRMTYALTGSLAAQRLASIASPRLGQVYVSMDVDSAAAQLRLRPVESGANVQLIRPRDEIIVNAARRADDGLAYVQPVQAALDLLTSPGRGPAEGEELLRWMEEKNDAWFE